MTTHYFVRVSRDCFRPKPGFEVVADCGSGVEAIQVIKSFKEIDIVLLDLDLGQERGADFLESLQNAT